MEPVRQQN